MSMARWATEVRGTLPALAAYAVVLGGIDDAWHGTKEGTSLANVASMLLVAAALLWSLRRALGFEQPSARVTNRSLLARVSPHMRDAELGVILVASTFALVQSAGDWLHPVIYVLAAFSATFFTGPAAMVVLAAIVGQEIAGVLQGAHSWPVAAAHGSFLVLFGTLHAVFLRSFFGQKSREHEARVTEAIQATRLEAREFRVIATALGAESRAQRSRTEEEGKLAEGAVENIHASMFHTLELLKRCLHLNTVVLMWLDLSGHKLRIKELVTDADALVETPIGADIGALGAVVKDRLLINLSRPRRGQVPYYESAPELGAFVGVPVLEDGHLRGVLCADRTDDTPFSASDEALLTEAATQILRGIQNERVFAAVERAKYEHERFFHASTRLGRALTPEQVMDSAIEAARDIVEFDVASISLFDREKRRHKVCRVHVAPGREHMVDQQRLDGLEFKENAGLASMVIKNKHYLPAGGETRDASAPVFTRNVAMKGVESLLVMPLVCADEAIGTFTLASGQRHAFRKNTRDMLGVIANQVAVSLENASMYRKMEQMATTDGLTGLVNHRSFQDRLADLIDRSERHGLTLSLILTDIDHFKKINDSYGHPVGDQVLRVVSGILGDMVRKIDIVARYGGEEFAIVIDGATPEGAQKLAERIRNEVAARIFQSSEGPFRITMSFGVAGFPVDARDKQQLIERADQSLYHAKHGGRNQTVTYAELCASRNARRAG